MSVINKLYRKINGGCSAVIVAAGVSARMNGVNKIFADLCGVPVIVRTLRAFDACELIDEIVLVVHEASVERAKALCVAYEIKKLKCVVAGGSTRVESVHNGLKNVSSKYELVAIHDGARPLVTDKIIREAINGATEFSAACPAVEMKSTVKTVKRGFVESTPDRSTLREIQTPQVFKAHIVIPAVQKALDTKANITDDCGAVEALGVNIYLTHGSDENIKITTRTDLIIAAALIREREATE